MTIDTNTLKESGIGKIILFYSRCPRCDPTIRRQADQLITQWMRPILRRSAVWRDRPIAVAEDNDEAVGPRRGASHAEAGRQGAILQKKDKEEDASRRHARIPQSNTGTYTVAPRSNVTASTGSNDKAAMERFRQLNKQLKISKAASKRL